MRASEIVDRARETEALIDLVPLMEEAKRRHYVAAQGAILAQALQIMAACTRSESLYRDCTDILDAWEKGASK